MSFQGVIDERSGEFTCLGYSNRPADVPVPLLAIVDRSDGKKAMMPKYEVNEQAVAHARHLIDARRYVIHSKWQEAQPSAKEQNTFLKSHAWDEYAMWHLGLKVGATDETKNRYAFGFGDFRRLHRSGLIACIYRAAEFDHKQVELAAHELLQLLDQKRHRPFLRATFSAIPLLVGA